MKALVLDAENRTANVQDIPRPSPGAHEILVKVEAISLNPIDPLYVAHPLAESGRTVGSDFAGIVSELGSHIPASNTLKIGDRVSGFLQGVCSVNDRPGAFAEYLAIPWDLVWKVPESVGIEEAAGVSLVALTAAQGMWYRLGLKAPFAYDEAKVLGEHSERAAGRMEDQGEADVINFFVYGASTSVGLYAAQMIRLSGRANGRKVRLFGAASKARWEMLRSEPYGYDHLVDYRDGDWPEQIRRLSEGAGMHYAYDCISEGSSVERVSSILASNGRSAIVRSRAGGAWKAGQLPVEPIYGAVWEGLGEEVQYQGFTIEKSPAARAFAVEFYQWLSSAVGSQLKPVPIRSMPGGLERVVEDGYRLLGAGKMEERQTKRAEEWMNPVSAEKLVYRL
ncbi:GroES-like protein [Trematosphaeria pertusa]|uniref:GroES-like protein n=1 Tax=Trematosphaeria pertusa TaxID=390896 RepID=A0A6A6ITA4_9PLEO|nr:GroES-like protein [Trematosphaeria pertusa]KAF2252820.1 GroES-like protein [Trematosphaeria pertusa]